MVIINALVLTPFILYALGFADRGMDWVHGALVAAMLAPTDAVSVTAILKAGALWVRYAVVGWAGIELGCASMFGNWAWLYRVAVGHSQWLATRWP